MIPGGSAAQDLDPPYNFVVPLVFMDFENNVYTVDGVTVSPYDLLDGLVSGNLVEAGLLPENYHFAKGALFNALRNALTSGGFIIIEWEAIDPGGYRSNDIVTWYMDSADPGDEGASVLFYSSNANGASFTDPLDVYMNTGSSDFVGVLGTVQRQGLAVSMPRVEEFFKATHYWALGMNGFAPTSDQADYRINASRVKRIDLWNSIWYPPNDSLWIVRKFEVRPMTLNYNNYNTFPDYYFNKMTDRLLPLSPPTAGLAKDHGGKTAYRFGPFPLSNGAAANRIVVAALVFDQFGGGSGSSPPTNVRFDGVAPECVASNGHIEVYQMAVPSGAEVGEILVEFAGNMNFCVVKVFDLITDSPLPYDAKGGFGLAGADVTLSDLAVRSGGKVLAFMKARSADADAAWTWGGGDTPVETEFIAKLSAVSVVEIDVTATAETNDLAVNTPAGATGDVWVMALSWAPGTVVNDPYWSSVKLMLGFDGADAATTFTAEEASPHALTFVGNAQLDTAQFKYGTASLLCDGTGDYVTTPDSADFEIGSSPFTIEAEVRFNSTATQSIISKWVGTAGNRSWVLERTNTGLLNWYISTTGSNTVTVMSASGGFSTGVWYHVRVSFDGTTYRLYVNGVQIATSTTVSAAFDSPSVASIGGQGNGTNSLNGWIDEVRVTVGVCRNPGLIKFGRPAAAHPRS